MSEVKQSEIRAQIKAAEAAKDTLKSWERLQGNRDFRKLISEGFIVTNAARQVGNSIDVCFEDADARAYALGEAQAAGYLKRYIAAEIKMLRTMVESIPSLEHTLSEMIRNEEGGDFMEDYEEDAPDHDAGDQE